MIEIAIRPGAPHQEAASAALQTGLRRHGLRVEISPAGRRIPHPKSEIIACWGWRKAEELRRRAPDKSILVIERGYVGDRLVWHSLGWDGLNGLARFPLVDDGGERWQRLFPDALQPIRKGGDYVLLLGQVRGDAAMVRAGNFQLWYERAADLIAAHTGLPLRFRPHPLDIEYYGWDRACMGLPSLNGSLQDALQGASAAFAFNSNSLTDAALAGVPVFAFDPGAMVWPLMGPGADMRAPVLDPVYRERWAHRLAWCQWTLNEIASGAAWDALVTARPETAPVWSEGREGWLYAA